MNVVLLPNMQCLYRTCSDQLIHSSFQAMHIVGNLGIDILPQIPCKEIWSEVKKKSICPHINRSIGLLDFLGLALLKMLCYHHI